ncbi:MAG TPA: hypothetical protein VNW71_07790 [Thermoanaerobaculia bacterium]|nr:hypothetical protein [Thermoanaerobaculia bacterium]
MKNRNILALAAALMLLASSPGLAKKARETQNCQAWSKGRELRCLFDDAQVPTATIRVRNTSSSRVSFSYDEWHSSCGTRGGKIESDRYENLDPGDSVEIFVLAPGRGVSCRESFVTDCRRGSRQVNCPEVLRAEGTLWVGNLQ